MTEVIAAGNETGAGNRFSASTGIGSAALPQAAVQRQCAPAAQQEDGAGAGVSSADADACMSAMSWQCLAGADSCVETGVAIASIAGAIAADTAPCQSRVRMVSSEMAIRRFIGSGKTTRGRVC